MPHSPFDSVLSKTARQLYKAMDPSTAEGRALLLRLTSEEVAALRERHTLGRRGHFWAAAGKWALFGFPAMYILLVLLGLGSVVVTLAQASAGGISAIWLQLVGVLVGVAAAIRWPAGPVSAWHFVLGPRTLSVALQPLSLDVNGCARMLKLVNEVPQCRAYRDEVVLRRDLIVADLEATCAIDSEVTAQAQAFALAEKEAAERARQEQVCRELHARSPQADAARADPA